MLRIAYIVQKLILKMFNDNMNMTLEAENWNLY